MAPQYLSDLLEIRTLGRDLRSTAEVILTNKMDTKRLKQPGQRSFTNSSVYLWNKLPKEIKNADNITYFKKRLKTHLFRKCYDIHQSEISKNHCFY